jgi:hypothetical protein
MPPGAVKVGGHDLFELLAAADQALFRVKGAGRNQVRLYVPRQPRPADPTETVSEADNEGGEVTGGCP